MTKQVVLITGATSGIGFQTAQLLADKGYTVYGVGRRIEKLNALKNIHAIKMDITDESSIQKTVEQVISEQNRIDILINNAGYGSYGAIEDVEISEARKQFEVNLFGLARLTQLVLPYMRKQHSGKSLIYPRWVAVSLHTLAHGIMPLNTL